jgi:hypothetical protein
VPDLDISIPLSSRRRERAQLVQKFQHAVPAVALLTAGAQGLMRHEHGFALGLAVGELAVSLLLLRSLVKAIRAVRLPHHAEHHHHGIDWFDVFAAGVLTAEVLEHWHTHHHVQRPTILLAAVTLLLGLSHGRLAAYTARRRVLRIDENGILVRGRPFRRFYAPWQDIERIDLDDGKARIVTRGGRERRIDLDDLHNGPKVRDALLAAQERVEPRA